MFCDTDQIVGSSVRRIPASGEAVGQIMVLE